MLHLLPEIHLTQAYLSVPATSIASVMSIDDSITEIYSCILSILMSGSITHTEYYTEIQYRCSQIYTKMWVISASYLIKNEVIVCKFMFLAKSVAVTNSLLTGLYNVIVNTENAKVL